jgi:N,N'-diacetyllegionaminate synthase
MTSIRIGNRVIGPEQPCFIIAEVGVNHNGDPKIAKQMIDGIAETGADCVKFQTFHADEFVRSTEETYDYYSQGKKVTESMLEMFRRLELKKDVFAELFDHARQNGLIPLSTPTDKQAVDLLEEIGAEAFKIGSDDLVYTPFLDYVAGKNRPMMLSTGMATADDIERAVNTIRSVGNDKIILLHCVSLYPTPEKEINLRRIKTLNALYDLPIGFSDHSSGTTAALGAVALGACVIEKHFTLDQNLPGPDHWFSADPGEMKALVNGIRSLETQLGCGRLWPSPPEQEMAALCHRSIVAARSMNKGDIINTGDLAYQRPGTGLPPHLSDRVIGRRLRTHLAAGTILDWSHMDGADDKR